jgi:AcrR family transcriptional regulator
MSLPTSTARRPRSDLDLTRIAEAGLRIVDEDGLGELTIRRLADELGASPTALYRQVRGKDDILAAVAELAFSTLDIPGEGAWRERLAEAFWNLRRLLVRHPGVGLLNIYQPSISATSLERLEALLGILADGGLEGERAMSVVRILAGYTVGFTLHGLSYAGSRAEGYRSSMRGANPTEHPRVAALAPHLAAADSDDSFRIGLDLIINGLDRLDP